MLEQGLEQEELDSTRQVTAHRAEAEQHGTTLAKVLAVAAANVSQRADARLVPRNRHGGNVGGRDALWEWESPRRAQRRPGNRHTHTHTHKHTRAHTHNHTNAHSRTLAHSHLWARSRKCASAEHRALGTTACASLPRKNTSSLFFFHL